MARVRRMTDWKGVRTERFSGPQFRGIGGSQAVNRSPDLSPWSNSGWTIDPKKFSVVSNPGHPSEGTPGDVFGDDTLVLGCRGFFRRISPARLIAYLFLILSGVVGAAILDLILR